MMDGWVHIKESPNTPYNIDNHNTLKLREKGWEFLVFFSFLVVFICCAPKELNKLKILIASLALF